jgi:hypothetical protein
MAVSAAFEIAACDVSLAAGALATSVPASARAVPSVPATSPAATVPPTMKARRRVQRFGVQLSADM